MIRYRRVALIFKVLTALILPSALSFAQTDAPMPAINDPKQATPALNVVPPSAATAPATPEPAGEVTMKSLLFSDSDITAIRSARLFYEQHRNGVVNGGIAEDDFLRNLEKITTLQADTGPKTFTYPQFFLSSIAYYAPNNWTVWINSEKINQNSGVSTAGLRVMYVDKEKVIVEWKPEKMDKIVEKNSADGAVKVDIVASKVIFTLRANQTFTSYAMNIVEGKTSPVTVNLDTGSQILENSFK